MLTNNLAFCLRKVIKNYTAVSIRTLGQVRARTMQTIRVSSRLFSLSTESLSVASRISGSVHEFFVD